MPRRAVLAGGGWMLTMTPTVTRLLLVLALVGSWLIVHLVDGVSCTGSSPTWYATPDQTSVQACIDSAVSGDTVNVLAGTAAWNNVTWTGSTKQIHLQGAGEGLTVITADATTAFSIGFASAGTFNVRVSHMTITFNSTTNRKIYLTSATVNGVVKGIRLDHLTLTSASATQNGPAIQIQGILFGVDDHVTTSGTNFQRLLVDGIITAEDGCTTYCYGHFSWKRAINLGSDEAWYTEDWTNTTTTFGGLSADFDANNGGAYVVRYGNNTGQSYVQTHSTHQNTYGARKVEVYNNTWVGNGWLRWGQLRAGSGVVYNNVVSNYTSNLIVIDGERESSSCAVNVAPMNLCSGVNSRDGNTEACGWPCVTQIGTGGSASFDGTAATLVNVPIYSWKNGTTATCVSGGTCDNLSTLVLNACSAGAFALSDYIKTTGSPHTGSVVDYVNNGDTPKPGYTAYTYPHPLNVPEGNQNRRSVPRFHRAALDTIWRSAHAFLTDIGIHLA